MLFVAMPAFAGRPFTAEDASMLEDKTCQVEAWVDRGRGATSSWVVPACNFGANIEWQAGGARTRAEGRSMLSEAYAQAKTVFPNVEDSPWNVGLVLGVIRRPLEERANGWQNPYALVPFTLTPSDTPHAFHASVGWRQDRADRRNVTLWGIAAEARLSERFALLGEAFGENAQRPFVRMGARYSAIKDRLDVDLSLVTRPGGTREERFVSLGVTWQSGRILP
jgi:hypothetical protein